MVYKVLPTRTAPVITLSPVVLAECGAKADKLRPFEVYLAGIF
jgi:hypothetical protein